MELKPQIEHERYFTSGYGSLERFVSYFHQIDAVSRSVVGREGQLSVLEIGVGDGTVSGYLRKLGYSVTGCDIDEALKPDVVADVRAIPLANASFDIVMACEVLEHIPFDDLEKALREMKRLSRGRCVISVPYRSTGVELILKFPFVRTLFKKPFLSSFLRIPLSFGGFETSLQHYWEIDSNKYSLERVRGVIENVFTVVEEGSPVFDRYHYYFLLS